MQLAQGTSHPPCAADRVSPDTGSLDVGAQAADDRLARVDAVSRAFVTWLDRFGETSLDFQSVYAGRYGRFAKSLYYRNRNVGTLAVAPLVFCQAFVPAARRVCWNRQRFPIGDAHYAMAFAQRFAATGDERDYARAVHFLEILLATASPAASGLGWGYPFDWVTIDGTIPTNTPLITTLPYVYEAFVSLYEIDHERRWLEVMQSIAEHVLHDYPDHAWRADAASCSYAPLPWDQGGVVNASAYRAFVLTRAWHDFRNEKYLKAAQPNLQFVLHAQNEDGSWYYAMDGRRDFIDHYHTCFVLKALLKIAALTGRDTCGRAIQSGLTYYLDNLFDLQELPRPFARAPRFTIYKRELYDYAECINLLTLAQRKFAGVGSRRDVVVDDILRRWQQPRGCFRTRQLLIGWDNVPMHRWGQAQLLRSLCGLLNDSADGTTIPAPAELIL